MHQVSEAPDWCQGSEGGKPVSAALTRWTQCRGWDASFNFAQTQKGVSAVFNLALYIFCHFIWFWSPSSLWTMMTMTAQEIEKQINSNMAGIWWYAKIVDPLQCGKSPKSPWFDNIFCQLWESDTERLWLLWHLDAKMLKCSQISSWSLRMDEKPPHDWLGGF